MRCIQSVFQPCSKVTCAYPTSETSFLIWHLNQGHGTSSKIQEWSTVGDCTNTASTPVEKPPQQKVARMDLSLSCLSKSKCRSSGPNFSGIRLKGYSGSHSEFDLNQKIERKHIFFYVFLNFIIYTLFLYPINHGYIYLSL